MTIIIMGLPKIDNDPNTLEPVSRSVHIWITDNVTNYVMDVGNLALTGGLQGILNAMEAELFTAAAGGGGHVATAAENEIAGGIQIYIADSGMKTAVFDKTMAQEATDIAAMLQIFLPGNTAPILAARQGMQRLLISSLIVVRVDARERGLV